MSQQERNGTALGFLVGVVLGYVFFLDGEVTPGSVLAALILAVAVAAIGLFLARSAGRPRRR